MFEKNEADFQLFGNKVNKFKDDPMSSIEFDSFVGETGKATAVEINGKTVWFPKRFSSLSRIRDDAIFVSGWLINKMRKNGEI